MRSVAFRGDSAMGEGFSYLPGTQTEVNEIDRMCRSRRVKDQLFTGDSATEASFKMLSGNPAPRVIHLATHGFFLPYTEETQHSPITGGPGLQAYRYSADPLQRSGLILAGGNRVWSGDSIPDGLEDGILRAKEVSNLDLRNTKLVVLSACETGLGDIKGSEGVFGLQRSFKMAGVDYLLMSLWQVPDEATQELMTMFYENLFEGRPIRDSFSEAQKRLRGKKKEYEDPYYWAAWVLME
jgi:CHAT domain-containing protein